MADWNKLTAIGMRPELSKEIAKQIDETAAKAAADAAKALDTKITATDAKATAAQNSVTTLAAAKPKWADIEGKPATFPAAAPKWDDVTGKPTTFPPVIGDKHTDAKPGDWKPKWKADIDGAPTIELDAVTPDTLQDPGDTDVTLTGKGFTQ